MPVLTTAEAFDEFDENLNLDPAERKNAQDTHKAITNLLVELELITAAFLQGSFARKTMIAPLRDIDKVVILHTALAGLSPDEVMDRIESALAEEYPDVAFERTRHSLKVDFGDDTFYFDIVPAWESDTQDDDVLIADRDSAGWKRSNTRELIRLIGERNQDTEGRFIHQVRMVKQCVKHLLDGIVPGLHVESWAFGEIIESIPHGEGVTRILVAGARLIGGTYTDPTGEDEISARIKPDVVAAAKPVLLAAAARAREARGLTEAGDHNEAIRIWHDLFGDCFPEAAAQDDTAALRSSFHGGAITSAGTVATATNTGQVSRPVRPWRPN